MANRPTLPRPQAQRPQLPQRAPQVPPAPTQRCFVVEEYNNGWFRAVDERDEPIIKKGAPGIEWQITGVSAKRVRERMAAELPKWEEKADGVEHASTQAAD